MATYKQGYKKQSAENVLLKFIVGIIVAVIVLVAILYTYSELTKWKNYSEYTAVTNYADVLDYTSDGTDLEDYVVYFYSSNDSSSDAKDSVLKLANDINKDNELFFIANSEAMADSETELDTFLEAVDVDTLSTPMLVVVVDGEFHQLYASTTDVVEVLESIEEGTFAPFN